MSEIRKIKQLFRTAVCLCLCACLLLLGTGCGEPTSEELARIYDDEEKLANLYNSYKCEEMEQTLTGNCMSGKFEGLEGMVRLWEFYVEADTAVSITYRMNVTAGKVKLVMIYPDNSVETITEYVGQYVDGKSVSVGLSLKEGMNRIKLVGGQGAAIEYEIRVSDGSLLTL